MNCYWTATKRAGKSLASLANCDTSVAALRLPLCAYRRDRLFEIVGQRRFEIFPFSGARVMEAELPCVEHLARKIFREARPVDFVAQHGMTEMMEMHADLMCAPAVKSAFKETRLLVRTSNAVLCPGRATAW